MSRWRWLLARLTRRLWFRAALYCLLGIATALAAIVLTPFIPADIPGKIGADAVDNVLGIIAASMLTVTTFSLSTMVAAYSAATTNATPRATRLLIEDTSAQNALSTFIGAFLFSLVGIIALSTGLYGDAGRLILFVVTVLVIGVIVVTLLRWIEHLSRLGRVGETIDRVEEAAAQAMRQRARQPFLGGTPLRAREDGAPPAPYPLFSKRIGYVQHVDVASLEAFGEEHQAQIHVVALPGAFVDPSRPLAWVDRLPDEADCARIADAFIIDNKRSFEQDPRFGLIVLSEIASRALSPAVNDPGTAIDVIGAAVRLLAIRAEASGPGPDEIAFPRVHVPGIGVEEMFDDVFTPIARDGAALVEVGIRLQKALRALEALGDDAFRRSAAAMSATALRRAERALAVDEDKARVRACALSAR